MKNTKHWSICCVALALVLLILTGTATAVIDPFFHYHAPLDSLTYPISQQRYQNYGILEHFSYDAILTGSSMTENFRTSECDALFGLTTVKVCLGGGTFKEFGQQLQHAIRENPDIKQIFYGLDTWLLFEDKDVMRSGEEFPTYLYDNSLFNDVKYILNKHILLQNSLEVLYHTSQGKPTTSFDDYSFWANRSVFDRDYVLSNYIRPDVSELNPITAGFFMENAHYTLEQNILPLVTENPQIQFYFFFTPHSILNMDSTNRQGLLQLQFDACSLVCELLLPYDNVHLFSFYNDYETITNLNNYLDTIHYSDAINSLMLQRMAHGEYALTKDNYQDHWQEVSSYYLTYDYDALFDKKE